MSPDLFNYRFNAGMRTILIGVGIIVIILLTIGIAVGAYFYRAQKNQTEFALAAYKAMSEQVNGVKTELKIKTNLLGQEQAKSNVLEGDKTTLQAMLKNNMIEQAKYLNDRLKEFDVRLKDFKSVTNFRVETSGHFTAIVRDSTITEITPPTSGKPADTLRQTVKTFAYADTAGWFQMKGVIKGDSLDIEPTFYNVYDLMINSERGPKRYWLDFFPPKITVAQVVNRNPYSKTKGLTTITQKPRRKILGIF